MLPRLKPLPSRVPGLAFGLCMGTLLSFAIANTASAAPAALTNAGYPAPSPATAELIILPSAQAAEAWLASTLPVGTALGDAPDFFGAANEVFFEADEGLFVFVYRSAEAGRWVAWVSFDADREGVVHTAAIDL